MRRYADPVTGIIAPPVADALDRFYSLPDEERRDYILRIRRAAAMEKQEHLKQLERSRRELKKRYVSPDLEACRESADHLFNLCDDFVEKMKKYEE